MICSARLDTSNTYRNRLSTPSGSPSIALFLLEPLGHPIDGFEGRFCLQLLRDDRRLQALRGYFEIIVDDDVLVKLLAGVDLVDRFPQPRLDLRIGVQAAVAQAPLENVERRRKNEHV